MRRLLLALLLAPGLDGAQTSPSPSRPWTPPAGALPPAVAPKPPAVPQEWLSKGTLLTLPQLLDVALAQNPQTRAAWFRAKAAAADVGIEKAAYYPTLDATANLTRQKQAAVGGQFTFQQTTYGPGVNLTWLLFDLGRGADVEEARQALYAANFEHDAVIQDVVFRVAQAFYQYQAAKALARSAEASLRDAATHLEAAEARREAGVATIADVLQARTARSQAELALASAQGQILTLRGALATAVGVPATIPVDAAELPEELDVDRAAPAVEALVARALRTRPDLLAARAQERRYESRVSSRRADFWPSLLTTGTANRTYYTAEGSTFSNNYSGVLLLRVPVFNGFARGFEVKKAEAESQEASANAEALADRVILDVWTGASDLTTAAQRVKTARDLLASASQSAQVAQGRYKEGVGSILDLLTAQGALANARSLDVAARADWLLALTALSRATGLLGPDVENLSRRLVGTHP